MAAPSKVSDTIVDLVGVKGLVARWIEELTFSGIALPEQVIRDLHDQLAQAALVPSEKGEYCIEIPGLTALGAGIFQRSFHVQGMIVRVVPYRPPASRSSDPEKVRPEAEVVPIVQRGARRPSP